MPELLVKIAGGERRYSFADLPVTLGGPDAQVPLPGWGRREPAAFIGVEGAGFSLLPGPLPFPMLRNGVAVGDSAPLRHEDRLRIGRAELVYYHPPGSTHATLVVTGGPAAAAAETEESASIVPVALGPLPDLKPAPAARRGFPLGSVVLALFLLALALAAAFVFSAKSVTITLDPAPETYSVHGRWPVLTLGASRLMIPGEYEVRAAKTGYHPFQQNFTVGKEDPQTHAFTLRKLPGRITVVGFSVDPAAPAVSGGKVAFGELAAGALPVKEFSVEPGSQTVKLDIPEFLPAETNLVVEGLGHAQELRVPLTPDWSMISFSSEPAGAGVTVNDMERGLAPLATKLTQGTYTVRFHLPLHVPFSTQIVVRAHSPYALPLVTLPLSPGRLRITSEPPSANLTTSFLYSGATPAEVEVTANVDHELRFSKAGYEDATATARVGPEAVAEKHVILKELLGEVQFKVEPADAEILLDGKPLPPGTTSIQLRTVAHTVLVQKDGFVPFQKTVTPRPGFPIRIAVTLVPVAPPAPPVPPKEVVTAAGGLKRVQPREYAAGSPRNEQGRRTNEALRAMKMTRPFYLGEKEVTHAQFRKFEAAHDSKDYQGRALNEDDRPVVQVTWQQAAAYCNWLSQQESLEPAYVDKAGKLVPVEPMTIGYRLPSEAEWEYCARLKDGKPVQRYAWGMDMPPAAKSGNYADLSAKGLIQQHLDSYQDDFATTAPPGTYPANELGLFDMGGNVAEWVHDTYDITPALEEKVYTDPLGPAPGALHVIKGASWMHGTLARLRLAYRDYGDEARPDVGFRVARYGENASAVK